MRESEKGGGGGGGERKRVWARAGHQANHHPVEEDPTD